MGPQPSNDHPSYQCICLITGARLEIRTRESPAKKDVPLEAEALMSSVEGACCESHQEREEQRVSTASEKEAGQETAAVGKTKVWKEASGGK